MVVRIPIALAGGVIQGDDLHLLGDETCVGEISEDNLFITVATNLTDCNNTISEEDNVEVYGNVVVEKKSHLVTRLAEVYIPFQCSYNRSARVGLRSYQISNYRLSSNQSSAGMYAFSLDFYRDGGFMEKYAETDYPIDLELNEDLYFGASVPSQDGTLDLSIGSCVATPSTSYEDEKYPIIQQGCAVDSTVSMWPDELNFVGVTMSAFRFVGLGNRVYIHCDLLVCAAVGEEEPSECKPECFKALQNRDRRDIIHSPRLAKKRVTQGPVRLRRSPREQDKHRRPIPNETSLRINPWMLVSVALATTVLILLAAFAVVLHKMAPLLAPRRSKDSSEVLLLEDRDVKHKC
ncbi:ZP domain-containing protein-like [Diadema antillarum]|uniref:ZP domain-containing protein-like n=1 Tax=Diadema antillarum TaxID=105358 RepID=UPI003A8BABA6